MKITTADGYDLHITKIERDDVPDHLKTVNPADYKEFWVAKDRCGNPYMWAARGYAEAPNEIVVWYRSGNFWSGWSATVSGAFSAALQNAWMHA